MMSQPSNYKRQIIDVLSPEGHAGIDPISQPHVLEFQGPQSVFPPPEKWIENEYARYEEPVGRTNVPVQNMLQRQTFAWATKDTVDLRSQTIKIPKGSQVIILDVFPEPQMCSVQFNQQVGVFKMFDFTHNNP